MVTRAKKKKKKKGEEKQAKSQKKQWNGPVENKASLLKYTNYHSLTALVDFYAVINRSLYRQPEAMKGDRSCRDIKKNYAFHKDIEHNTKRCVALRDEIERLMRAGHFKEFMDEP